jgi:SAM-dependent methyltransferase
MNPFTAVYFAFLDLRNRMDFALRQRVHTPLKPAPQPSAARPDILSAYPSSTRAQAGDEIARLRTVYHFDSVEAGFTERGLRENYFYLAMLDEAFRQSEIDLPVEVTAADIGPSSWFYVQALAAALTHYGTAQPRAIRLTGFEVDAYRLYADFHTRRDHALANMRGLAGVKYVDHGFEPEPSTYDVITSFFPFVFEKDHMEWGLPGRLFNPPELLKASLVSLKPGGLLVIVNQGLREHGEELRFIREVGYSPAAAFKMEPLLFTYPLDRYIITVKK